MIFVLSLSIGMMTAGGVYLILRPQLIHLLFGFAMIGNAVNLSILTLGNARQAPPPLIPAGEGVLSPAAMDPLPQALVLTAIVIGFGMLAYLAVLLKAGRDAKAFTEHKDLAEEEAQ